MAPAFKYRLGVVLIFLVSWYNQEVLTLAVPLRRVRSKASIRSPNTVPWAQPDVCTFFLSLSSKFVSASVRTTTVPVSSSYATPVITSSALSMFWLSR